MTCAAARQATILFLGLALAACGPLPRPFQSAPQERAGNDLLQHPEGRGIHVLGIDNRKGARTEAAAAELRAAGLPAGTALSNAGSYVLTGYSRIESRPGPNEAVKVQWVLSGAEGKIVSNDAETLTMPDGLWREGSAEALRPYLAPSMRRLAARIAPSEPERAAGLPGFPGARLAVGEITAPGDGTESLGKAMERALAAEGLPAASEAGPEDLVILGDVTLTDEAEGLERVKIAWTVRHPREAEPLGTIRQENVVPKGMLSGRWGANAAAVVQAAVPGILELLDKAARLRGR